MFSVKRKWRDSFHWTGCWLKGKPQRRRRSRPKSPAWVTERKLSSIVRFGERLGLTGSRRSLCFEQAQRNDGDRFVSAMRASGAAPRGIEQRRRLLPRQTLKAPEQRWKHRSAG